jgi:hypothetical protein
MMTGDDADELACLWCGERRYHSVPVPYERRVHLSHELAAQLRHRYQRPDRPRITIVRLATVVSRLLHQDVSEGAVRRTMHGESWRERSA